MKQIFWPGSVTGRCQNFRKEVPRIFRNPQRLLGSIAKRHGLHLYDVPSLEGSDVHGFIAVVTIHSYAQGPEPGVVSRKLGAP